nr:putative disease resistance RPP13-like protein 1 [Ziziphus jujuba var. spinosa]XP_048334337.1 putative disease resistance RPP13-like protein 1 [Ziziphus jujuba var. spinosa]XP_048334338.1 putative disease resistance RPP13-like protein 1 [Ziziphus jujuba var. spinosa]XP_048334339.1 putative disease resistance RPP13-like protein 1 [Ziziphus jujuba var. spinosa]XP_048334340.1 putative disease resistance RPP13-like protein 1 [Ziziphus jujuba var. spinosa]XP_048334341.1 putative disease resistan
MAAEMVGGAALTFAIQELSRWIPWIVDFVGRNKVNEGLVRKLKTKLLAVDRVLNDAEMKQIKDPKVRQWLDYLKEAIGDAEDLVYEVNPEALQSSRVEGQSRSNSKLFKVRRFIPSRITSKKIEERIDEILEMLEYIVGEKDILGLREGVETVAFKRSSPATLVDACDILGRSDDKLAILNLLCSNEEGGDNVCVIPIVGMGGIGKTCLAQLVYEDIDDTSFDVKAWITLSDESDVSTLTKTIYQEVTGSEISHFKETYELQLKLKKFLGGKRLFLVLDGVWNLNYENWCRLTSPFKFAAFGSKIVVTTRNKQIASKIGSVPSHSLQLLSEEDCWQLFSKRAFNKVEPSEYPKLEDIGKQIVKKCRGLPLAVRSLACLLRTELDPKKWKDVLENEIWDLPQEECEILPALWLSYYYLPSHLKRCFTYCSIFPKDYEYQKEKLTFLWMAGDLLLQQNKKLPEEVGEDYFDDLESRSLFQKNDNGSFSMHSLLNDLAKFVAGESYLRMDDNYSKVPLNKIRHLSWTSKIHDMKILKNLSENKVLQTLLRLDNGNGVDNEFLIPPERLENFQHLRVFSLHRLVVDKKLLNSIGKLMLLRYLDLSLTEVKAIPCAIFTMYNLQTLLLHGCSNLHGVPDLIGNLKCLRHLDLSHTQIEEIPDTVCDLQNLHTLLLGSCENLARLPTDIGKLDNLRCLDISETSVRETPPQLSSLRKLEVLTDFVVGTNSGSSIKMLGKLQCLRGNLNIRSLENVADVDDVSEANLKANKSITSLSFGWNGDTDDSQKAWEVLNRLQPHPDLEQLYIINYGGRSFPDWIGNQSFSRVVDIWLSKCKLCQNLPALGQLPFLKSLKIDGFDMVKIIGDEFYISGTSPVTKLFKSLQTLTFKCMPQWKKWSLVKGEVFSQLKELHLMDCPSLTLNVACFLGSLQSLKYVRILKCQRQVVASLLSGQLPSLCSLHIQDCPDLVSFPERRLPTTIRTIKVSGCKNLESFSDDGWPSDLKSLSIVGCGKLFVNRMQWNLHTLTSLSSLDFTCIDEVVDSFPEEGQIPTALTSLKLSKLKNLRSLNGMAFRQLITLRMLSISYCDGLNCFPKEGLPASLYQLEIISCCSLKERCQRDKGRDWSKISHISQICIDKEYI